MEPGPPDLTVSIINHPDHILLLLSGYGFQIYIYSIWNSTTVGFIDF
jgi:hypothetical protein